MSALPVLFLLFDGVAKLVKPDFVVMPSEQLLRDMGKFNEELVKAGVMLAGEGLQASSKGKRVRFSGPRRTVIDGPFAETKELIAGFWLWKVKSMEEAVEWMMRCPNPHNEDGEVEIRQVFDPADFAPCDPIGEFRAADARLRKHVEATCSAAGSQAQQ
jgi:hypothetical protein